MNYSERLARLVYRLMWIGIAAAAILVGRILITGHTPFATPVDKQTGTAALLVATDAETGCQYILTPWGGITPRTGRDGHQVCPSAPDQPSR